MDSVRFDRWTKTLVAGLRSRRGLLRLGGAGGLAALGFSRVAEEALACRRNKKPCAKSTPNGNCCSGTCKRGKCRPTKDAAGCTVQRDFCQGPSRPCPKSPELGACVVLDTGKPYCATVAVCHDCASHAECTALRNGIPGKCVRQCSICPDNGPVCVYRQFEG
jgi:hypothetical protein